MLSSFFKFFLCTICIANFFYSSEAAEEAPDLVDSVAQDDSEEMLGHGSK